MIIKIEEKKPEKIGAVFYSYDTFYPCDGYKECGNSPDCGTKCKYTLDINHWKAGTKPIRTMSAPYDKKESQK